MYKFTTGTRMFFDILQYTKNIVRTLFLPNAVPIVVNVPY